MKYRVFFIVLSFILIFSSIADSSIIFQNEKSSHNTSFEINDDILIQNQWPSYKCDFRNSGRSVHSAATNMGGIQWKYLYESSSDHSAVIDSDGIIYVPTSMSLHAVNPNGTEKWIIEHNNNFGYTPVIDDDKTIYHQTGRDISAYYQNGTQKWTYHLGESFMGDPVFSHNNEIIDGTSQGNIYSFHPNGSIAWSYYLGEIDYPLHPAIDSQGNIYFTTYFLQSLISLNPEGNLRWSYIMEGPIQHGPVIDDTDIIYIVSLNTLISVNPNGTENWNTSIGSFRGYPSISPNGNIILSGIKPIITSLDSSNGEIIWQYDISLPNEDCEVTEVAIDSNGINFFVYTVKNYASFLSAISSHGSFKWETNLPCDISPYDGVSILSDPIIGKNGTVYINNWYYRGGTNLTNYGYLYSIDLENPSPPPNQPTITGKKNGKYGESYEYTFQSTTPDNDDIYYFIDWDDDNFENWIGPYSSGTPVKINHTWETEGSYTIRAKAKSIDHLCGPWSTLEVSMPVTVQNENYNGKNIYQIIFNRISQGKFSKTQNQLGFFII